MPSQLLRCVLAGLLAWAAAVKIAAPAEFAAAVHAHRLLPDSAVNAVAILLPWLELSISVSLLLKPLRRPAAALAGFLLLLFAVVLAFNLSRGMSVPCGCFKAGGVAPAGWGHVALNLSLAAGCAWLWRRERRKEAPAASRATAARGLCVVAVAVVLGTAANAVGPRRLPWREDWSRRIETLARTEGFAVVDSAAVRRAIETGEPILLDARPAADFAKGRIPAALSLPPETFDAALAALAGALSPERPVILYCSGSDCDDGLLLARNLKAVGFADVKLYVAGFKDWTDRGEPVDR